MTESNVKSGSRIRNVLPFSRANIENIPSGAKGVYAYWYRVTGMCIYVGKAEQQPIKTRLMQEWRNPHNNKLKLWMRAFGKDLEVCYLSVKSGKISRMEKRLIKQFNPETNITYNRR